MRSIRIPEMMIYKIVFHCSKNVTSRPDTIVRETNAIVDILVAQIKEKRVVAYLRAPRYA